MRALVFEFVMQQLTTTETTAESASQWTSAPAHSDQALSPAEVEELLQRLGAEAKRRGTRRRIKAWIIGGYLAVTLIMLLVKLVMESKFSLHMPFIQMWWLLGGVGAASKLQKESVRKLAKSPDLRGVGYFVEALGFDDKDVKKEAAEALVSLLPQLKASDAHLLNDEQRTILYKQLRKDNSELILAILKSLEQIGDEKAVPFVEELANAKANKAGYARIREAAQACLPALNARVARLMASHTLLRATEAADPDSSVLLRPAAGSGGDTDDLLRPVESPPDNDHEQHSVDTAR
jgi:hypothetical protein